jgi:hypothetical protein
MIWGNRGKNPDRFPEWDVKLNLMSAPFPVDEHLKVSRGNDDQHLQHIRLVQALKRSMEIVSLLPDGTRRQICMFSSDLMKGVTSPDSVDSDFRLDLSLSWGWSGRIIED